MPIPPSMPRPEARGAQTAKSGAARVAFRMRVRGWLYVVLGASALAFAVVLLMKVEGAMRTLDAQRETFAGMQMDQAILEERMALLEISEDRLRRGMESKMTALDERQSATDARASGSPIKSPFPIEGVIPSIVQIVCLDNNREDIYYAGSGTVIEATGVIVTNQHLLLSEDGSLIRACGIGFTNDLKDPPRVKYVAATVAVHKLTDLALLQIREDLEGAALPASFAAVSLDGVTSIADRLKLGDPVYIGGYPDIGADTFTFTQGVVSGRVGPALIKTSAIIDTGASGGAAFDSAGKFIGVPTAAAKGEIGSSLGYLIGADVVEAFVKDYFGHGNRVAAPVE